MKWAVVARMRGNKEDTNFYKKAFELMFHYCRKDHPKFNVGDTLKGIIVDWSDTETKGLREVVGDKIADSVLKGCNVHWTWSYQHVAEKVNSHVHINNRLLAKEAFCTIAKQVMSVKNKDDVLRLFDVLQAEAPISSLKYLNLPLSDEHFTVVDQDCDWTAA